MFDKLLDFVAPHICCGCGNVGSILCEHCIDDISNEPFTLCVYCLLPSSSSNICKSCKEFPVADAWAVSTRTGTLKELIDAYKFERVTAADAILAQLLDMRLPVLPPETLITAVPTSSAHIRRRGYDHTARIAKRFARMRQLRYKPLLKRTHDLDQLGADRTKRLRQQQNAFVSKVKSISAPVLIIDDIMTTGATIKASTGALASVTEQ